MEILILFWRYYPFYNRIRTKGSFVSDSVPNSELRSEPSSSGSHHSHFLLPLLRFFLPFVTFENVRCHDRSGVLLDTTVSTSVCTDLSDMSLRHRTLVDTLLHSSFLKKWVEEGYRIKVNGFKRGTSVKTQRSTPTRSLYQGTGWDTVEWVQEFLPLSGLQTPISDQTDRRVTGETDH